MNGLTVIKNREERKKSNGTSKLINVGHVGRRPSDNLLKQMISTSTSLTCDDLDLDVEENAIIGLEDISMTPPTIGDRHLSDNSVGTNNSSCPSDIFSNNNYNSSPDGFNSRTSSIVDDVNVDDNVNVNTEGEGEDDIIDTTQAKKYMFMKTKTTMSFTTPTNSNIDTRLKKRIQGGIELSSDPTATTHGNTTITSNSSSVATSTTTTPVTAKKKILPQGSFYAHSNSTSAILQTKQNKTKIKNHKLKTQLNLAQSQSQLALNHPPPMTPSQKYRMRRVNGETKLRNSIKGKEKFYDEQDNNEMELQEGDIDGKLIWNIPMASVSTSSFLHDTPNKKSTSPLRDKNFHKKNNSFLLDENFYLPPPTAIPGINNTSDFQYMENTTREITNIYKNQSAHVSQQKLEERNLSSDFLPIEIKELSKQGMEDLILVSEEKLNLINGSSRPSWLPPKDELERESHNKAINKTMSIASIEQLDKKREREERKMKDDMNHEKYILIQGRGIRRRSSLKMMKKLIYETSINGELRYEFWKMLLTDTNDDEMKCENFKEMMNKLNKMNFPKEKEIEIKKLIKNNLHIEEFSHYDQLYLLLQLKSISMEGIESGDEIIFFNLLSDEKLNNDLQKIWNINVKIQKQCFNDNVRNKFDDHIVSKKSLLYGEKEYTAEFNKECLNFKNFWNIMKYINNDLFLWILDIIIYSNANIKENTSRSWYSTGTSQTNGRVYNYEILVRFTENVLINYHIGFNNLNELSGSITDPKFRIPIEMEGLIDSEEMDKMFVKRWINLEEHR
ncbi:hypothetical protein TBLA_0H01650 [Henningerozyma blattae CBS 6284]|uniref:Uncharacterized protein n=1 Tax=Henningerozyma blattae (strain ATCC 34711 / CBS 6284 / DSM 70876 / NBRC 10599 / NRRL Y-10934 / UCD 77-7) TaxID=1071380 RepID=I2H7V0_HENB6|nr:hypothetical protein TBLA_0H01650 [Tetrapisispora blattae CBS 6284]CCH62452.1 hypothetical protein TBLA_0H01650 [Tetrapisispora blattae CBS 6284]